MALKENEREDEFY